MANDKISLNALIEEAEAAKLSLNAYLLPQSAAELEITEEELLDKMAQMLKVMEEAAAYGLTGVRSHSGLTGGSALKLQNAAAQPGFNKLLGALATDAVTYALAVSECNAAMGRIVAAPTAGAAGVLPGVLLALKKHCNLTEEQLARALVVAGQIGLVIAARASLAGAVGGCQAECGSAAGMTAAAMVELSGGTPSQCADACAVAIANQLGLVCDPVAGLVEIPCVKRNAGGVVIAFSSADIALAGIGSCIPVDECIIAMRNVGNALPASLRETAGGGLAATPTGRRMKEQVFGKDKE